MFTSLRSRLWLTYALLIGVVFCVVGAGLLLFLLRTPFQSRQAYQRLAAIATLIQQREFRLDNLPPEELAQSAQRADKLFNTRDEFLPPIIEAGVAALILSLLLALWMGKWIARPLQRISTATRSLASGNVQAIPPSGPAEIKTLANAFNEMTLKVQASQKSQRDFIANVSHELKTPLTSIQGFAQAILDGTANTSHEVRQSAEVIYSEAERMHRLAIDLLDLARFDSGIAELQRSDVNLTDLLNRVAAKLAPQARQAQVNFLINLDSLTAVLGDPDRLEQVFTNLLDNAIQHSPAGENVQIALAQTDSSVEVSIIDHGLGIPTEDLTRIFDRFYQVDKSRQSGSRHGAGLGLSIAREIVLAHGGTITVESTPNKGSTFHVRLPRTPCPSSP